MKVEDLEHLSIEELKELVCNYYNEIDVIFLTASRQKGDNALKLMNMSGNFIGSSRKFLNSIKKR